MKLDRISDMGFIHDVKKIISIVPDKKQTLLFSATMPPDIEKLAHKILKNQVRYNYTGIFHRGYHSAVFILRR